MDRLASGEHTCLQSRRAVDWQALRLAWPTWRTGDGSRTPARPRVQGTGRGCRGGHLPDGNSGARPKGIVTVSKHRHSIRPRLSATDRAEACGLSSVLEVRPRTSTE